MADQDTNPARGPNPVRLLLSESIPSDTDHIEPLVDRFVANLADLVNVDGHRDAIDLALREALANAIVHGNKRDASKLVKVECYALPDRQVLVVVRDEGAGFDPASIEDPTRPQNLERVTGRGIFLIRQFMDEVRFRDQGREIQMRKKCC